MDKKFYEAPEMEIVKMNTNVALLNMSNGAGDPPIDDHFGGLPDD